MQLGAPRVYPTDYYQGDIAFVSRDRMRYVGENKYLKNIIYCSINPDNYLYFKSANPQFLYLDSVRFTGIFQDSKEASKLGISDNNCDVLESSFPLEDALIPPLIELVVKELLGAAYRPADSVNNANDDLEGLAVRTK